GTSSTVKFTNANAYMSGTTAFYNVTVDNGASLTLGTDNIMRIAGTLTLTGTGILAAANNHNTVEYNGAAQNVINPNGTTPGYHNLILSRTINTMPGTALTILGDFSMSGTASATAGAAMTIGGNVTIGSGTTFNASKFSHLFGGNLTNDGTFTGATSTITFNGTAAQTIGGSVASAFNNLTVTNTSAAVLVNTNTNIGGTLFMDGATTTLTPGAAVVFNNAGAAGTITGSGTVQVTRTASTADYSSQYIFSTNTLTNLTVEYAVPTGSQVVSALTYGSLKLDNTSGTNTTGGVITSGGTFTTTAGGTLNMGSNALTVYAVAHSGILTTQNTSATPLTTGKTWGGTVQYDASAAQTVAAGTYNNLNLSNSGEKTTTSATVNGILSMEGTATASAAPTYGSDATLQYNTATARAAGVEWITPFVATGGVIIANSGTITMTGAKVLSGSVPLTINNGASLTIDAAGALTVDGTLTNNAGVAGLVIKSISSGTGSLINSSTGVSATVERYMTGGTTPWHLISSPVEGQDIHAFVDATANAVATNSDKYGLAPYVTSTPGWAHYTASTIESAGNFVSGQGYEVLRSADGTVSFAGTIPTGAVSPSVYYNAASKWWNILGNPYSSSIMINPLAGSSNFLTANSGILETGYGAIYIWNADESTPVYDIINNVTAYYVPPGQSFFVHTKSGASTASFTAAMRTHSTSGFKSSQTIWPSINLNATIAGNNKNTRIYYIPGTTLGIDEGYDAGIFEDNNPLIALSTHIQGSNIDFGIQSLPDNDYENIVVPVGLNAPNGSAVVFSADAINLPANTKVYLEDKLTKKFTRLDEAGTSYSIQLSSASKGTGRFYLHTKQGAMGIDENEKDNITAIPLPQEQIIRIIGPVEPSSLATLYDMNGRMLVSVTLHNYSDNEIAFTPVSDGIYLLQIQSGTTLVKRKICWVR
ncbi:MAG: T9SS type A sorting domain-containing protein, partial [Bacteroidia bacterium]|nr:T9SS type A sorting domain-containing protein [Bacteroidia bacterium]